VQANPEPTEKRVLVTEEWVPRHCVELLERRGVGREDIAVTADVFIQAELMGRNPTACACSFTCWGVSKPEAIVPRPG
jgi:hypothetical protein